MICEALNVPLRPASLSLEWWDFFKRLPHDAMNNAVKTYTISATMQHSMAAKSPAVFAKELASLPKGSRTSHLAAIGIGPPLLGTGDLVSVLAHFASLVDAAGGKDYHPSGEFSFELALV